MQGRWLHQSERQLAVDLSLEKHTDQTDSIPSELISFIGLITENNSSSRNASQSTLTIAG